MSEALVRCVFCKATLTRPAGNKWWMAGERYGEGLCYDCILAGMRMIMASVEYAQEHGRDIAEFSPDTKPELKPND